MIKKYLEGTFLEIYRGQKVWQTYRFDKGYEGDSYKEFRKIFKKKY